jgi:hypothetical protein
MEPLHAEHFHNFPRLLIFFLYRTMMDGFSARGVCQSKAQWQFTNLDSQKSVQINISKWPGMDPELRNLY